jgi:two-component system chemotaxis response regulator CheV
MSAVVNLRGQTLPVIDLSQAIGMRPLQPGPDSTIIVTEYNRSVQAFLVGGVDRIVNMNWESIMPPPSSAGRQHYLTAITKVDEKLVEIDRRGKVLAEIVPYNAKVSATNSRPGAGPGPRPRSAAGGRLQCGLAQLRDTLSSWA